jgi:mRNA interferase MazF
VTSARRGDVWIVDFGDPIGHEAGFRRPAVVVSDDAVNAGPAGVVIVVPITSRPRGNPVHVEIEPGESGLDGVSYARCEDVRSLSDARLVTGLGRVSVANLFRIEQVLGWLLGLPPK